MCPAADWLESRRVVRARLIHGLPAHTVLSLFPNVEPPTILPKLCERVILTMEKPAEDDFGEVSARFMSWLHKRGASVNPKISLTDLRSQDAGRGVGIVLNPKYTRKLWLMLGQWPSKILSYTRSSSPYSSRTYLAWRHPRFRSCYRKNFKILMNSCPWFLS